nr:MAG TPA: hypothetical protein [Bacteriophage sp.]
MFTFIYYWHIYTLFFHILVMLSIPSNPIQQYKTVSTISGACI